MPPLSQVLCIPQELEEATSNPRSVNLSQGSGKATLSGMAGQLGGKIRGFVNNVAGVFQSNTHQVSESHVLPVEHHLRIPGSSVSPYL